MPSDIVTAIHWRIHEFSLGPNQHPQSKVEGEARIEHQESSRIKHHLFSSAFPGISSPSTDITLCDVTATSANVNHIRYTLPPS